MQKVIEGDFWSFGMAFENFGRQDFWQHTLASPELVMMDSRTVSIGLFLNHPLVFLWYVCGMFKHWRPIT